jgi:cell division protein FtsW
MTATQPRGRKVQKVASRGRHPASSVAQNGRGPRRFVGATTRVYVVLLLTVMALVLLGTVMVLSASAPESVADTDSAWSLFWHQLRWVGLGLLAMTISKQIDYHLLRVFSKPLMIGSVLLLIAVLLPGVGASANGATRWLAFGGFRMQPSELAKFAVVLFAAELLSRSTRPMDNPAITVRPIVVVTSLLFFLLLLQPHLGGILVIGAIVLTMLFLAGAPLGHMAGMASGGVLVAGLMVWRTPWRRDRLFAFLDPTSDPNDAGYQALQALGAITEGGWTGLGLGGSYAKYGFLPEAHTDFIFAIIAEELGLVFALGVVLGFVVLGFTGMMAAVRAPDRFGLLLGIGITSWITVQAVLNLGAVLSLLPVTGVTLPFLSFGGSSLVVTLAATGVLLNIARQGQ